MKDSWSAFEIRRWASTSTSSSSTTWKNPFGYYYRPPVASVLLLWAPSSPVLRRRPTRNPGPRYTISYYLFSVPTRSPAVLDPRSLIFSPLAMPVSPLPSVSHFRHRVVGGSGIRLCVAFNDSEKMQSHEIFLKKKKINKYSPTDSDCAILPWLQFCNELECGLMKKGWRTVSLLYVLY